MKGKTVSLLAVGAAAGLVNGFFGTGGGTVMVLALITLCRVPDEKMIFANVCASVLPISVASALAYSGFAPPDLWQSISVGSAALAGGVAGGLLLGRIKPTALKLIFSAVMMLSGGMMLIRG